VGLRKSAPAIVGAVIGDKVGKNTQAREDGATRNARKTYDAQQREGYRQFKANRASAPGPGKTRPVARDSGRPGTTQDF
jgi:hypothetical protein